MFRYIDIQRLFRSWQKDLKLWVFLMGLMTVCRIGLMGVYWGEVGEDAGIGDALVALIGGMRFDMKFALGPVILVVLLGLVCWNEGFVDRVRLWVGIVFGIITLGMGVGLIGFYGEYKDIFNQWVFGLVHDDLKAVLLTIWHGYPVVWMVLGLGVVGWGMKVGLSKFLGGVFISRRLKGVEFLVVVVVMLFMVKVAVTGSVSSWRTLSRRDTAVTVDVFLNKAVYNPYYSMYSAVRDYKKRQGGRGIEYFLADGDVKAALDMLYGGKNGVKISDYLKRRARGAVLEKRPKHIFLVVMESQDSWPLMDEHEDEGLAPNLKRLGEQGLWVEDFLPSGVGTMAALNTLIMGVPEVGVESQYEDSARALYSTAIAGVMKRLDYNTRLYYGGYLSWRKLGELANNQGFEKVYGIGHMGKYSGNEWGVDDRGLFSFIKETIDKEEGETFNLIMTTSNHPPYSVNLEAEGWHGENRELGHAWYGDKCLGEFVEKFKDEDVLFIMTGDHWSRRFCEGKPSLYERSSVPLIMCGNVLSSVKGEKLAGCHLDIIPTLVEMLADEGFEYYAMGQNILGEEESIGYGAGGVIVKPGLISAVGEDMTLTQKYNAMHGIGWWRIKKGEDF